MSLRIMQAVLSRTGAAPPLLPMPAMSDLSTFVSLPALTRSLLTVLQRDDVLLSLKDAGTGRYLWANAPMLAWLGVEAARLPGSTDLDLLPQADATALRAADQRALASGLDSVVDDHRFERATQRHEFAAWRSVLPAAQEGASPCILNVWRDAGAARRQTEQWQQSLAQIERQQTALEALRREHAQGMDRPSELFRREHFDEHLRREVALSQREEREFALVLLAIDAPEALCDTAGPAALQRVVESIGELMRRNTRAMDVLAQLGDDRFAILFSGVGLATAHARVEQLRRACATQIVVQDGKPVHFEISAGIASFPHTAQSLDALSTAASSALTDARARGGNQVALARIRLPEPQSLNAN